MIVSFKDIATTMSMINDIVASNKNSLMVMFDMSSDGLVINFTDGTSDFTRKIDVTYEEGDVREQVGFDLRRLKSLIDACAPTSNRIITDEITFIFESDKICKVRAEKKILIQNGESDEAKVASVVDQAINYDKLADNKGMKAALIKRPNYAGLLFNSYDEEPEYDEWEVDYLRDTLSRLTAEQGKVCYIAPKNKCGFVVNTSSTVVIALKNEINLRIIATTAVTKMITSLLSKMGVDTIKVFRITNDIISFCDMDCSCAFSIKVLGPDPTHLHNLNACLTRNFDTHLTNFNNDVLYSCVHGATVASDSDKIEIAFDDSDEGFQMKMRALNTVKSIDNKYDVNADFVLNSEETKGLKINAPIDLIDKVLNGVVTQYVAFDVSIGAAGDRMVRIGEIDLEKRAEVAQANGIEGSWSEEQNIELRKNILNCCTYFRVAAD